MSLRFPERVWSQGDNGLWSSRCLEPIVGERLDVMDKELARRELLTRWWYDFENPPTDREPMTLRAVGALLDAEFDS